MDETKLGKYKIVYLDSKEYHTIKREIWGEDIYYFESKNKDPFIIDVGAHIGISVIYFKSIYPNSQILAFEPNPISFEILEKNISNNDIKNVVLINKAVWKDEGNKDFYATQWSSNSSFLFGSWTQREKVNKIVVNTTTLHKYIDRAVDLLKIDTEGSELNILKAHKDIFKKVKNICIEYHPSKDTEVKDILNILKPVFNIQIYQEGKLCKKIVNNKLLTIKGKNFIQS